MFTNELYIAIYVAIYVAPVRALPWERSRKSAHATGALPCKTARGPAQSRPSTASLYIYLKSLYIAPVRARLNATRLYGL